MYVRIKTGAEHYSPPPMLVEMRRRRLHTGMYSVRCCTKHEYLCRKSAAIQSKKTERELLFPFSRPSISHCFCSLRTLTLYSKLNCPVSNPLGRVSARPRTLHRSVKTRRAPSWHCRNARIHGLLDYGHARQECIPPLPSSPPPPPPCARLFRYFYWRALLLRLCDAHPTSLPSRSLVNLRTIERMLWPTAGLCAGVRRPERLLFARAPPLRTGNPRRPEASTVSQRAVFCSY